MEKLEKYVGKNYNKINKNKFNFAGFFFGEFYLVYRKRFIEGLILSIINAILSSFGLGLIYLILLIVERIFIGVTFNKLYIKYCNKNIDKLNGNSTNVGLIFALLGIELVISLVISLFIMKDTFTDIFNNLDGEDYIDDTEIIYADDEYNGEIMYKDIEISDYFSIDSPSVFNNNLSSENSYDYRYDYEESDGVFNSCSFSLVAVANYTDYDVLPGQMVNYFKEYINEDLKDINNNNLLWKYFSYKDSFGTSYMYTTKYKDNIFVFTYNVGLDTDDKCITYKDTVFNSIKAKN